MCLRTNSPKSSIAKSDIVVYKALRVIVKRSYNVYVNGKIIKGYTYKLTPSVMHVAFEYKFDKLFKTRMRKTKGFYSLYDVHYGFHSYQRKEDAVKFVSSRTGYIAVRCIIPKGSRYYEGSNNVDTPGYCSNQIIVKNQI